jgi:hypothetical protein
MTGVTDSNLLESLAIERTVVALWAALDAGKFDDVASKFAEDGIWHRQGKQLRGPAQVHAAMAERHPGTRTRHLLTNVLVNFDDPNNAEMSCYMCVFHHQGEADALPPAPMNLPITVTETKTRLKRVGSAWKITDHKSQDTFRRK